MRMLVPTSLNGRKRRGFRSASSCVADRLCAGGDRTVSVETGLPPHAAARACADAMWQEDRASQGLGIEIVEIGPGRATLQMTVQPHMVNGHGIAHGGFIFTLADSAFAFACNSHNDRTVAAQGSISFIRPGKLGDIMLARASEVSRSGRSGIYDVRVTAGDTVIAEFR